MTLRIACLQMTSGDDIAANIKKLHGLVEKAAIGGAQLIASPENTFLMKASDSEKHAHHTQEEHPGVLAAAAMAKQNKCWLLIGSVAVKVDESGKALNRSLLFNPGGEIVAHYDKIHLFDVEVGDGQVYKESARIIAGQHGVLGAIGDAKLGMTVCYDVRFPHLYRALAKAGANILAVPAAFTQVTGEAHWHVLLRARAIENSCFVIAPAQTGTHPGNRQTYGHSLIIDPWGKILADGGTQEGVIMADIDLGEVAKVRKRLPSLEHDRPYQMKA